MTTNFAVEPLTPRQREVLTLLADGFSNREIAERLGITLDGAKWHVSEILGRLGVDSREEAVAAWRSYNSPRSRFLRFGQQAARALTWPWLAVGATAGVVAAAVVVIAIAQHGSDPVPAATIMPDATIAATTTPATPDCPVDTQAVCDFALAIEPAVHDGDFDTVAASNPPLGPGVKQMAAQAFDGDAARLVSIGCPFGAVSDSCADSFSLVFTTLASGDDWTGRSDVVVLRFERPSAPHLTGVNLLVQADSRRAALGGGMLGSECNVSGTAAGQSAATCSRSMFYPFASGGPFLVKGYPPASQRMGEGQGSPPRENAVMYVATGCWGCEGNDTGLDRIVRGTEATPSVETGTVTGLQMGEQVTSYEASGDGSLLLAATCADGHCDAAGQADGQSRLLGSTDGGYTWNEIAARDGLITATVGPGSRVLVQVTSGGQSTWSLANPADPVDRPSTVPGDALPQFMADGTVGWFDHATESLFSSDGSLYFRMPQAVPATAVEGIWNYGTIVLAKWSEGSRSMIGFFDLNGATLLSYEFRPSTGEVDINPAAIRLANVTLGVPGSSFPALMEIWTGMIYPFYDPFGVSLQGRNRFLAYVTGPFLRVTGAGDCLNVRAEASATADVLRCYRDGVLFVDEDESKPDGATTWLHVRTPDGRDGWASEAYLAPIP